MPRRSGAICRASRPRAGSCSNASSGPTPTPSATCPRPSRCDAVRRRGPRATVGSLTELGDYLRLLFARRRGALRPVRAARPAVKHCGRARGGGSVAGRDAVQRGFSHTARDACRPRRVGCGPPGGGLDPRADRGRRLPAGRTAAAAARRGSAGLGAHRPARSRQDSGAKADRIARDGLHARARRACTAAGRPGAGVQSPAGVPALALELPEPEPRLFDCNDPRGACPACEGTGVVAKTDELCPECAGRRWNRAALAVLLAGHNIAQLSALCLVELDAFLAGLPAAAPGERILSEQLRRRLGYLTGVDLGHLTLLRPATTLSGGATVRVRLATALAANLAQCSTWSRNRRPTCTCATPASCWRSCAPARRGQHGGRRRA